MGKLRSWKKISFILILSCIIFGCESMKTLFPVTNSEYNHSPILLAPITIPVDIAVTTTFGVTQLPILAGAAIVELAAGEASADAGVGVVPPAVVGGATGGVVIENVVVKGAENAAAIDASSVGLGLGASAVLKEEEKKKDPLLKIIDDY